MKHCISSTGYPYVTLKAKIYFIHRLLADHFIPNPEKKREVNHKNGIRTDFRLANLEWVTREENQRHSWSESNRKAVWQDKDGYLHHASKPVNQYDSDGNFITQYGSTALAAKKNGWHPYSVQYALDKRSGYYKGYTWTYAR